MATQNRTTGSVETPATSTWRSRLKSFMPFFGRSEPAPAPFKSEQVLTKVGSRLSSCTANAGVVLEFDSITRITLPIPSGATVKVRAGSSDYMAVKDPEGLADVISRHFKGRLINFMSSSNNASGGTGIALLSGDTSFYIDSSKKFTPMVCTGISVRPPSPGERRS